MPDLLNQIGRDTTVREELAEDWGVADLRFYSRTESTQGIARALADAGASGWTLVLADHQTAGKGRDGNRWISQPGSSVMFSLLLRPERPEALPLLPVRIGLILARALDDLLISAGAASEDSPFVRLKWPNDLIIDNGKVGGILVEGVTRGDQQYVIVGVGLNVFRITDVPPDFSSLPLRFFDDYLPEKANRLRILERMVTALREQLRTVPEDLMPREIEEYAERDWLRGRQIVQPLPGRVVGINRKGYLLIENGNDDVEMVMGGSVKLG
ncbi:MAG: biotin--[acetyl-CoA-carboxylase] ligase [Ignavibacteriae bacterium]|nr:biotin--[acetyl-CoA-carboxylase] ligase [Ignavibacteriota bacterium]MCB9216814.1 biotin--[acetyl-CoA-carboxylase] ligase [Ignavibacteria bacterium]